MTPIESGTALFTLLSFFRTLHFGDWADCGLETPGHTVGDRKHLGGKHARGCSTRRGTQCLFAARSHEPTGTLEREVCTLLALHRESKCRGSPLTARTWRVGRVGRGSGAGERVDARPAGPATVDARLRLGNLAPLAPAAELALARKLIADDMVASVLAVEREHG